MTLRKGLRNHSTARLARRSAAFAAAALIAGGCARSDTPPPIEPLAPARVAMNDPLSPAAAESAMPDATAGIPSVPPSEAVTDTAISARVKAELEADPAMNGADVSVNTDHGVVNLTGQVRSYEQAAIATSHAQRPDGVMRIESHLAVEDR
jgi:hypothetical protein